MTCATNRGKTWIIDGKGLKAIIQYFDTRINALKEARDLELFHKDPENFIHLKKRTSEKMKQLYKKRENEIRNYINRAARIQIDLCRELGIGTMVVGYNKNFQDGSDMNRETNRFFMKFPFGMLKKRLKNLCDQYGIVFVEQEESYTSQASFFDFDPIPVYGKEGTEETVFSGVREKRGRYVRNTGQVLNADYNAALNIMRKSAANCKAVIIQEDLDNLCRTGLVVVPQRIRVK